MSMKVVIVDMNTRLSSHVCQLISTICLQEVSLYVEQAFQTAFMLACLSTHTEILFPLKVVDEESLPALRCSIETLVQYHQDTPLSAGCSSHTISQCLQFVLETSSAMLSNAYNQVAGNIDILFITCQKELKNTLDSIISQINCPSPKKVTVLTLIEEIELESLPEFLSEIEDVTVTPHSDNIQKCMRSWLFWRENKLLTLHLPGNLMVSCDMTPLSIDVSSLSPAAQHYLTLGTTHVSTEKVHSSGWKLSAFKLFKSDLICESVLFGSPMLLLPSTHWAIEWDELEKNQHIFTALCKSLAESDQVLLCKNTEEIHSLFLILAEPGGSALIKPIISLEFFLPKPNIPIIQPSQDALQLVTR